MSDRALDIVACATLSRALLQVADNATNITTLIHISLIPILITLMNVNVNIFNSLKYLKLQLQRVSEAAAVTVLVSAIIN